MLCKSGFEVSEAQPRSRAEGRRDVKRIKMGHAYLPTPHSGWIQYAPQTSTNKKRNKVTDIIKQKIESRMSVSAIIYCILLVTESTKLIVFCMIKEISKKC